MALCALSAPRGIKYGEGGRRGQKGEGEEAYKGSQPNEINDCRGSSTAGMQNPTYRIDTGCMGMASKRMALMTAKADCQ